MKYMLDTNICIYIIKKQPDSVLKKFKSLTPNDIGISSITLSELLHGAHKSQHYQKNSSALQEFTLPLSIMPFDEHAADQYGRIRTDLEKRGNLIGALDLMIAAHAQSLKLTLVTNHKKEFTRVQHLKIEDWVRD